VVWNQKGQLQSATWGPPWTLLSCPQILLYFSFHKKSWPLHLFLFTFFVSGGPSSDFQLEMIISDLKRSVKERNGIIIVFQNKEWIITIIQMNEIHLSFSYMQLWPSLNFSKSVTSILILTFPEVIAVTVLECDHDLHAIGETVKTTPTMNFIIYISRTEIWLSPRNCHEIISLRHWSLRWPFSSHLPHNSNSSNRFHIAHVVSMDSAEVIASKDGPCRALFVQGKLCLFITAILMRRIGRIRISSLLSPHFLTRKSPFSELFNSTSPNSHFHLPQTMRVRWLRN